MGGWPRRRLSSWSSSTSRIRSGPPGSSITPRGVPKGSAPTVTATQPSRLRHEDQRVAAGDASQRAELVAGNENVSRGDAVRPQVRERPARGIGLVGKSNLNVLRVTADARIRKPTCCARVLRDGHDIRNRSDSGCAETLLYGAHQVHDPRFWRIRPLRQRDDVHLPAVEALGDDRRFEAARRQPLDGKARGTVELFVLFERGDTTLEQRQARVRTLEDLGPTIDAEDESTRSARASVQLPVDIVHVGAGDDHDIEPGVAQGLDQTTNTSGVSAAIRYERSVPIGDAGLETAIKLRSDAHGSDATACALGGSKLSGDALRPAYRSPGRSRSGLRTFSPR